MPSGRAPRSTGSSGRTLVLAFSLAVLSVLGGCASAPGPQAGGAMSSAPAASGAVAEAVNPIDPWEHWNRKVYAFNDAIDKAVAKPVAEAYRNVVPSLVRRGVDNVLGNLHDIWSTVNNFLQGKFQYGLEMGARVLANTTMGLGGLLDPATEMRLTRHTEDFGDTLGHWGVPSGPFVMLPLLGPSTVRESAGFLVDHQASPSKLPRTATGRDAVTVIEFVNARANLLDAGQLMDQVALDRYSFLRDAYLAQRRNMLYNGAPPLDTFDDGADDAAAAPAAGAASAAASAPAATALPASAPASAALSSPQ